MIKSWGRNGRGGEEEHRKKRVSLFRHIPPMPLFICASGCLIIGLILITRKDYHSVQYMNCISHNNKMGVETVLSSYCSEMFK